MEKIKEFTCNGELKFRQKYIDLSIKTNEEFGNVIKTEDGIISLSMDIREIINHNIFLGEKYIEFNIENNFYDKDPFCRNRLLINTLEEIEGEILNRNLNIKQYDPYRLFTYFNSEIRGIDNLVDDLLEKEILIKGS